MRVVTIPCLKDNFAYLVIDGTTAAVVDPGEAAPVEAALAREGVTLAAIWATHHHADHVGGAAELMAARPGIDFVIGTHDAAKVPAATRQLEDGGEVTLGTLRARAIHNPGHTRGAISYVVDDAVFTGDTLFGAGCGRLFEGDAATMHASLAKLAALPPETRVYFGHEYTASNLAFAAAVEPDNVDVAARAEALVQAAGTASTPSTIALERATNPFLRSTAPDVVIAAMNRGVSGDAISVFGAIRAWKDAFRA
ncbi:MAG: hydroxyacylglutathione hydrolase [Deltaproteobacteria bacterium]|nr:hydroxyacylglutathione hydrolase [Deltaproteobacteria bacterium]MDQ3298969.1 hydroxyacylglutathione hydrolase [Myxococcota bacterium]